MRRVLQVCGVAAAVAALVGIHVPVIEAQGIVSGVMVPPISVATSGMPIGATVLVPSTVSPSVMPGISVGMTGTGSGSQREVNYQESNTSEPATIKLGE